jgi:hypothetical protein
VAHLRGSDHAGGSARIVLLEATVHLLDVQRALDHPPLVPSPALKDTAQLVAEVAPAVEFIEAATGRSTHSHCQCCASLAFVSRQKSRQTVDTRPCVMALSRILTPRGSRALPETHGFVKSSPHAIPEYRLPAHRLQLRQYLLNVFLSGIPSEFLRDVRPRGSPPTGAGRPAHLTLTYLIWADRDAMSNVIDLPAPSIGIFTLDRLRTSLYR